MCKGERVEFDERGIDYLIEKWYKPTNRPFRMCQPRDILDQMMSIAKYNMERVNFSPDLIDAACETYFISNQQRDFGAEGQRVNRRDSVKRNATRSAFRYRSP